MNDTNSSNQRFDSETFLKNLTHSPGVYQMLNSEGDVIYVGKARNLQKRVSSYFNKGAHDNKTLCLLNHIADINILVTPSENEALLLESNLIKKLKPKYNVLLRDDKSYPYIFLSSKDTFPRIDIHRGAQKLEGEYYGPYPSASAVRKTLHLLQQLFKLRQCSDSYFKNRSRPCLQYQIKRCSAPCVGLISEEDYRQAVYLATLFLSGKSQHIIDELTVSMQQAADNQAYEKAAHYRDLIKSLRHIQQQQVVTKGVTDLDIIACYEQQQSICFSILYIRNGLILGNKNFFPKVPLSDPPSAIMSTFLSQYYLSTGRDLPRELVINIELEDDDWLSSALSEYAQKKVTIQCPQRGVRKRWLAMALANAEVAMLKQVNTKSMQKQRLQQLQVALNLSDKIERIECFDISHSQGQQTIASCVVFDNSGLRNDEYRRFNINNIQAGDDYAAMAQALARRYSKRLANNEILPSIVLIDGGKGQVSAAQQALTEIGLDNLFILGISKGPSRKAGLEQLWLTSGQLAFDTARFPQALHVLQTVRDEAHRFAITGHRRARQAASVSSNLEHIPGIGQKRRQQLLKYFGGMQGIKGASVSDIANAPGISQALAQRIYDSLH